ncbi:Arginase [Paraburkholderia sacchari]|uniref:arginase family protein n=1 Tax=Paraburkholderia sacchari TaxID=159450 RepID=UPI0039A64FB4
MSSRNSKTLRLNIPQWQGGNLHEYHFGSQLLSWLAPPAKGPVETIDVPAPRPGERQQVENGVLGRAAVVSQLKAASEAIKRHQPDRIVTLGGDCLVDLAPIAYLNKRYGGNLGVLWVDAHPDLLSPDEFAQGNTYPLGALLGRGDSEFVGQVEVQVKPSHVMYAGLNDWSAKEGEIIDEYGLRHASAHALSESSEPVLDWIRREGISQVAVHFDIDVLDPRSFGAIIFNNPDTPPNSLEGVPQGKMTPQQVARLLHDVANTCDLVGLAIAEYLPWEAIATRKLLESLPLFSD